MSKHAEHKSGKGMSPKMPKSMGTMPMKSMPKGHPMMGTTKAPKHK